ncbi:MAG: hypothetical protein LBE06_12525, partial [Azoarcus sp.]|nr:hypothetical protein [Azoarcus sp.]
MPGHGGNDVLWGWDGDDTLEGGAGDDSLTGGGGNDTYLFARGDGKDVIHDRAIGDDVIKFTEGIRPEDVEVSYSDKNLVLRIKGTEDQITVGGQFVANNPSY